MSKKKKDKSKKRKEDDDPVERHGLSQETKNGVWGKAGVAGQVFASISKLFFGWGIFLIPAALIILGASFIKSFEKKIYRSALIGTSLFVLSFLGTFHIVGSGDLPARIGQGGYFGLAFGYPLFRSVGFLSSFVVLILLIFVSLMIALDIPFHRIFFKKKAEGEEDEGGEKDETKVLNDNIVIRQGAKVVDDKPTPVAATASAVLAKKQQKEERENTFVIKYSNTGKWNFPPIEILHSDQDQPRFGDINANANIIKRTLANFSIDVEMGEVSVGPTVTQFTMRPAAGVKLSRIPTLNSHLTLP